MATQAPAAVGTAANAQAAPVTAAFRAAAPRTIQRPGNTLTATMGTAPVGLGTQNIPAITILRDILIEVTAVTTSNAATVAFQPDAPLNVFSNLNFRQAGAGGTIFGGFNSYQAFIALKWFGYPGANNDVRANATYSQTTGVGSGAGGSFTFVLRIPVEYVQRTGVGSLPATTTQSPLALDLTLNQLNAVYSTAPTNPPVVTAVISWSGYANVSGNPDGYARPANFGTMNAVQSATVPGAIQGQQTFNVPNVGFGNVYRNAAFLNYATGGNRSDTAFPSTFDIKFRNSDLLNYSQLSWKQQMSQNWGYTNTTLDAAGGLDTGVYVWTMADDFDRGVGAEMGNAYISVGTGDNITISGNWGASSNLTYLVNFLVVNGALSNIQGR